MTYTRGGPNPLEGPQPVEICKEVRSSACGLAVTTQLRTKYKFTPCFCRLFPSGVCSFSRMIMQMDDKIRRML
jgi:hypothetical protein